MDGTKRGLAGRAILRAAGVGSCLLAACLALPGCGQSNFLEYTLERKDRHLAVKVRSLTVVFGDSKYLGPDTPQKATGILQVAGPGPTSGTTSVDAMTVNYTYASGAARVAYGEQSFRILERGTKIEAGKQTFPTDGPAKTILLVPDGTVRVIQ
jgi:hypothetical protein